GTIVNADINASAEIAVSKLADGAARQLLQTDAAGTGVEWASNIDIPGTLDVTSTATFDSTVTVTGLITANGKVSFPAGTAAAPGLYSGTDIDTGIYAPAANQFGITTNGTSRFVIDGSSVGINTTLPQAELDVHGVNGSSEVMIRAASGSNTSTLRFERDSYSGGAKIRCDGDTLKFLNTVSNQERITITSDGSVGIGVTNPSEYNGTSNNLVVGNHSGANGITIAAQDNNAGYLAFADGTGSAAVNRPGRIAYDHSDNTLRFETNLLERVVIDSSGNVGIGNTSPAALLDLGTATPIIRFSDTDITGYHQIQSSNSNFIIHADPSNADANSAISFKVDNSDAMKLDSSGRVLVGTSSFTGEASAVLEGSSAGGTTQAQLWLNRGQTNPTTDNVLGQIIFGDATASGRNGAMIQARVDSSWGSGDYPSRLGFFTTADNASSPTERMRISSNGQAKFTVNGASSYVFIHNENTTAGHIATVIRGGTTNTSDTTTHLIRFQRNDGTEIGKIRRGGFSSVAYDTSSDYRIKANIVPLAGAIERVKQFNPVRFNWIEDTSDDPTVVDGFLAHEAQTVVPEAVSGYKDEVDDDGNPVIQGLDQSKLVPLLTAALQEAIAKIETLEQRLTDAGL
ncbi:MAG: tail fiber domain-containing protein, partial [Candidatus Puniceispirillaceae bacterium]